MASQKFLLADDDRLAYEELKRALSKAPDIDLVWVSSGAEAIELIKKSPRRFAAIGVDHIMPGMNGPDTIRELLKINPDLIIATYSGDRSREAVKMSQASGALEFLDKGSSDEELIKSIRGYFKKYEEYFQVFEPETTISQNGEKIRTIGAVGRSGKFAGTADLTIRAANSDCNVVIYGETGTGKELIAKAVHYLSKRKTRNFFAKNMANLSPELFESELFGHVKGSFTGAVADKVGLFKLADGGTVFLDEIVDLRLDLQARLLRFIDSGEFFPVGSNKLEKVNVRIVAASNIPLETAVAQGKFRQDLYYRLNVLKIINHPLRDRPEDIRPLVHFFQTKYRGSKKIFSMRTIRKMESYSWPGNIRELENEIERIVETVPFDKIEPVHLDAKFFLEENKIDAKEAISSYDQLRSYIQDLEKTLIRQAHKKTRCLKLTAEVLGIGYSTLRAKVKEFNLIELGV